MLFGTKQMQVMESGLSALAARQKAILNNLANYETPGYKAKDVAFGDVFRSASGRYQVEQRLVEKNDTVVRPDGNNVDADAESLKLYENYVQTQYLYQKVTAQISNFRYVLKSGPR